MLGLPRTKEVFFAMSIVSGGTYLIFMLGYRAWQGEKTYTERGHYYKWGEGVLRREWHGGD